MRTFSWIWPRDWPGFRVLTATGTRACWIRRPIPRPRPARLIVYGLAYGVNTGLLDASTFTPVILKGWKALTDAVEPDGKLGWVQPIGADPKKVTREMTEVYGVGAFLAAGVQVYTMLGGAGDNGR